MYAAKLTFALNLLPFPMITFLAVVLEIKPYRVYT